MPRFKDEDLDMGAGLSGLASAADSLSMGTSPYFAGALDAGNALLRGKSWDTVKDQYNLGKDIQEQTLEANRRLHPTASTLGGAAGTLAGMGGTGAALKSGLASLKNLSSAVRGAPQAAQATRLAPTVERAAVAEAPAATPSLEEIMARAKSAAGSLEGEAGSLTGMMNKYRDQGLYKDEAGKIADWIGGDKSRIEKILAKGAGK